MLFMMPSLEDRANSGLEMAMEGVESYLSLGIPKNKLVLGLPWYGYRYTCIQYFQNNNTCVIEKVEFQGAPCSDAAGRQFTYAYIKNLMNEKNITQVWENDTATPYYNYEDPSVSDGTIQMRYDNPHSLKIKIDYAMNLGLLGAGMWNANSLDPSDSAYAILQRAEMWGVMP
uniref:Di-N-acetylchitobiase-like n=1 Tax=Hirondellea gigas TaxID=1518452 RepID=A0A2P2IB42_9CRUS